MFAKITLEVLMINKFPATGGINAHKSMATEVLIFRGERNEI